MADANWPLASGVEQSPDSNENTGGTAASPPIPRKRNLDDCIQDLLNEKTPIANVLPPYDAPNGDTWAFIRPPSREPEHNEAIYNAIRKRYERPFRVASTILRDSESNLILKQLGSPTAQFRVIRRLGVKPAEMQANGIRYVLDLTPPVEGDEAVEITEQLSCPTGILKWARKSQQWRVSATLVGGLDEFTDCHGLVPDTLKDTCTQNTTMTMISDEFVPDYTPLRHRFAIERVLRSLHGEDPSLDSAPKVYTTVMVAAKHLGIPAHRLTTLRDYVVRWIRAMPNSYIIEAHPDIILKIADCLECEPLCKDAFALLVGEAALQMNARYYLDLSCFKDESIYQRPPASVAEIWETRIQYARDAFVERISRDVFENFLGQDMPWIENLLAVKNLPVLADTAYMDARREWLTMLKAYIRGSIYHVLVSHYAEAPAPLSEGFQPGFFVDIFNKLDYKERILTRTFWKALRNVELTGMSFMFGDNLNPNISLGFEINDNVPKGCRSKQDELLAAGVIERIDHRRVDELASTLEDKYNIAKAAVALPGTDSSPTGLSPVQFDNDECDSVENSCTKHRSALNTASQPLFSFYTALKLAEYYIEQVAIEKLAQPNWASVDLDTVDTIVCLNESELKFLPLWAGGVDDGSNGVFGGDVPMADEGFGPGRAGLRSGESEVEFDGLSTIGESSAPTSKFVNDGHSFIANRRKVYAASEVESVSNAATSVAATDSTWEAIATPAESVEGYSSDVAYGVESMTFETTNGTAGVGTEDYSDIFMADGSDDDVDDYSEFDNGSEDEDTHVVGDDDFKLTGSGARKDNSFLGRGVGGDGGGKKDDMEEVICRASKDSKEAESIISYKDRELTPLTFDRD